MFTKELPTAMAEQKLTYIHVQMKDEDPRLRSRKVPMKVLVLGYPRTGTSCISHLDLCNTIADR